MTKRSVIKFFISSKMHCLADVAFTPVGPAPISIEEAIALCIPILDKSGVTYVIHRGGFTIDAEWGVAMTLIGKLHERIHEGGYTRVHSDLRVGTRTDKEQTMQDKLDVVNKKLALQN